MNRPIIKLALNNNLPNNIGYTDIVEMVFQSKKIFGIYSKSSGRE